MSDGASNGAHGVIELASPIKDTSGKQIKKLNVRELFLRDRAAAQRKHPSSPTQQTVHLLATQTDLDADTVMRLKTRDARKLKQWASALATADDHIEADASEHTFELLVPVLTDSDPITEIRVREPDLGAAIASEKLEHEAEQIAAMIASLSDQTIQIVMRMADRDVDRIEAYLTPFLVMPEE